MRIQVRRVYDDPSPEDGMRILVDRQPVLDHAEAQVRQPQRILPDAHRSRPSSGISSTLRTLRHWKAIGSKAA